MRNKWIWSAIAGWLLILLLTWQPADAGPNRPVPTPTPPKPTWTPGPAPLKTAIPSPIFGAPLELQVAGSSVRLQYWTVIQWQDENRQWHDVDGWKGTLDEVDNGLGLKGWWVNDANFGEGPFHWQVYDSLGGKLLVTSTDFNLPTTKKDPIVVAVSVPAP